MNFITVLALVFLACNKVAALNPLPFMCTVCYCEENVEEETYSFDCSSAFLSTVPPVSDWPENLTRLDLRSNNITSVDVELVHESLRILDLSHNEIQTIAQSAFGGLRSLQYLNLAGNNIKHFDGDEFYGLDQLKSLNLSSNGLYMLPDKLFSHFIGLQELSLSNNPTINDIERLNFDNLRSLRWLDISFNNLGTLNPKIFHTNEKLEFLSLSANEFYDVPTDALRSAKSLKHLRLNENPITSLSQKSFVKLNTIEILELNFMDRLEQVEDETFSEMTNLRVLEIIHNRQFRYISPKAFSGLFNDSSRSVLEELDLEGNQLQSLHSSMVPCARLRKFNLQKNPWVCDCSLVWIKDCEIESVYLADLKCASPSHMADLLIVHLKNEEFECKDTDTDMKEEHHNQVLRRFTYISLSVLLLALLSLSIALVFKWSIHKELQRRKRKGPGDVYYVTTKTTP